MTLRYRKEDENGDFTFGHGLSDYYVDQAELVAQSVKTRLGLYLGEWFLNTADGTPWLTKVIGKNTSATYNAVIRTRILETEGVTSIEDYSSSFDRTTRKLTISCKVNTIYGQATVTTTI